MSIVFQMVSLQTHFGIGNKGKCGDGQESNLAFAICGDTVLTLHHVPTDDAEWQDLNKQPLPCQSNALPVELHPRRSDCSDSGTIEEIASTVNTRAVSVTRQRTDNPCTGSQKVHCLL